VAGWSGFWPGIRKNPALSPISDAICAAAQLPFIRNTLSPPAKAAVDWAWPVPLADSAT
jgi:hypothetical protein